MKRYKYNGTGNNGTLSWLMQRISGIIIILFGLTVFYQLGSVDTVKEYDSTVGGLVEVTKVQHSLQSWFLLPLLVLALWHTFSGFKMIMDDYISNRTFRFILLILFWLLGLGALALGIRTF